MFQNAQSNAKIEELLQEDQNAKRRREKFQRQSSLLSKLARQLSIHDNRAAAASWSDGSVGAESPRAPKVQSSGDDWRSAFDAAANGSMSHSNSIGRASSTYGHSRRYETANGDVGGYGPNSGSRRTPNRLPPAPLLVNVQILVSGSRLPGHPLAWFAGWAVDGPVIHSFIHSC